MHPKPEAELLTWTENVDEWTTSGAGPKTHRAQRTVAANLDIPLSDVEKARLAEDIADTNDALVRHAARKALFMELWKAKASKLQARHDGKISAVRTGIEHRTVQATEVYDHRAGTRYFEFAGARFNERGMKDQEYLIGAPRLFDSPVEPIHSPEGTAIDATLVASAHDGRATRTGERRKTAQPPREGMTVSNEVRDVMREERSPKTKKDHTAN